MLAKKKIQFSNSIYIFFKSHMWSIDNWRFFPKQIDTFCLDLNDIYLNCLPYTHNCLECALIEKKCANKMDSEFIKCRQSIRIEIPFKGALCMDRLFSSQDLSIFFKFWLGVFELDFLNQCPFSWHIFFC